MKNLKEIAKQLEIEIKNKKKDLAILKTDQIMSNLTIANLTISIVENAVTKYSYYQARPKVPYRNERSSRLMTMSLGNVEKMTREKFQQKKNDAIILFKERWMEMRNDFEILKNNS